MCLQQYFSPYSNLLLIPEDFGPNGGISTTISFSITIFKHSVLIQFTPTDDPEKLGKKVSMIVLKFYLKSLGNKL